MQQFQSKQVYSFYWVNDFNEDEANQYLTKLSFTNDKIIRNEIFEKIGTRPSHLRHLCASNLSPNEYINDIVLQNKNMIKLVLKDDPNYLVLLKEMIKNENNDGISPIKVMDIFNKSYEKIVEDPIIKLYHILTYDHSCHNFRFHSNSMKIAVKEFLKEK
jgi:hypothetical protein